ADGAIRVQNPMNVNQAALRTTLLDGLVDSAQRNLNAGNERIALFEIARIYLPSGEALPNERLHLGGIVEGGFERAKGVVEALYKALRVELRVERSQAPEPFFHPGKAARTE